MDTSFVTSFARIRKALRFELEARAAELDITAAQYQVLRRLWEGDGIFISALTKDICSDGGTMTGILDRLETKGLVCRERCAEDRRAVKVFLTPAGKALEAPLMEIVSEINGMALKGFTPEESERLIGMLERIGGNLGNA